MAFNEDYKKTTYKKKETAAKVEYKPKRGGRLVVMTIKEI